MLGQRKQAVEGVRKSRIRKGDEVVVLAGKDRGKKGKVLRVDLSTGKAVVERVNLLKKHTRPNPAKNQQGGILEREAPVQLSNLQLVCPGCDKPTRVGVSVSDDGERSRVCRKCGAELK